MKMSPIETELRQLVKIKPKANEDRQDWLGRLYTKLDEVFKAEELRLKEEAGDEYDPENPPVGPTWEGLTLEAQAWFNDAYTKSIERQEPIRDFTSDEEGGTEDTEADKADDGDTEDEEAEESSDEESEATEPEDDNPKENDMNLETATSSKSKGKAKANGSKPAKKSTAKFADKPKKEKKAKASTPRGKYKPDQKITLLVKENPKRKGSAAYKRYEKYKSGMSVEAAQEAGMKAINLDRDVSRGFIKIA